MTAKQISFETTIEINAEINVTVSAMFYPGRPAVRQGFERFVEPDEPDELEIVSVVCGDTGREYQETEISASDWERLETEGFEVAIEADDDEF